MGLRSWWDGDTKSAENGEADSQKAKRLQSNKKAQQELEKERDALKLENQRLNTRISGQERTITWLQSEIKTLESYVWPLETKLKLTDHPHVNGQSKKATWVLDACLTQFEWLESEINKLVNEKAGDMKRYQEQLDGSRMSHETQRTNLIKSHQIELGKERARHRLEADWLQSEINRLEAGLMTNVNRFEPMSDSALQTRFKVLQKAVENLARHAFDIDPDKMDNDLKQIDFVSSTPPNHWRFLLQGEFWRILGEGLFRTPFGVFGASGEPLFTTWCDLFRGAADNQSESDWPGPGVVSDSWRSVTFEALLRAVKPEPNSNMIDMEARVNYDANMKILVNRFTEAFRRCSPEDQPKEICDVVELAASVALDFGIQRCRLQLFEPQPGWTVPRNTGLYHDVNNSNQAELREGTVQLVVAPGLRRIGDGRGYTFHDLAIILPATLYFKTITT